MNDSNDSDKIRKLADSALLLLASRASAIIIVALCGWILNSVSSMKTDVATVIAKLDGHDTRITTLETWRNNFDAYADEPVRHR